MPSQQVNLNLPKLSSQSLAWPTLDASYTRTVTISCADWLAFVFASTIASFTLDSSAFCTISGTAITNSGTAISFTQSGGSNNVNGQVQLTLTLDTGRKEVLSFEIPIADKINPAQYLYARMGHLQYSAPTGNTNASAADLTTEVTRATTAETLERTQRQATDAQDVIDDAAEVARASAAELAEYQRAYSRESTEITRAQAAETAIAARITYVSLSDFNPVGDGVTDDKAAFDNAINVARSISQGGTNRIVELSIPTGVYAISSALQMVDSTGLGFGVKIVGKGKPTLKSISTTSNRLFNLQGAGIEIRDLILDGNQPAHTADRGQIINATNCTGLVISGCDVVRSSGGIHIYTSSACTIEKNTVTGSLGHGIYFSGCFDSIVRDNVFTGLTYFGVILTHASYRNLVIGNRTTSNGIELFCCEANCYENRIMYNHAEGTGDNGLSITGFKNTVVGNIAKGCQGNGICVYGDRNTVTGNICLNNAKGNAGQPGWRAGIALISAFGGISQGNTIVGNTCDDEPGSGTQIYGVWMSPQNNYQQWAVGQAIATGGYNTPIYRFYGNNLYASATAGTTGATPPTHTSGDVSDGGVTWTFLRTTILPGFGAFGNEICGNVVSRAVTSKYQDASGGAGATANEISGSFQPLVLPTTLTAGSIGNAGGLSTLSISNPTAYQTSNGNPYTIAVSAPQQSGGSQASAAVGLYSAYGFGTVAAGGSGYAVNDVISMPGGTPSGAVITMKVTAIGTGGAVTAFLFNTGSILYSALPGAGNVAWTTQTGTGTGFISTPTQWRISTFAITPGSGYTAPPTVTASGGTGGQPILVATTSAQISITAGAGQVLLDNNGTRLGVNGSAGAPVIAEGGIIDGSSVTTALVSGTAYVVPLNTSMVRFTQTVAIASGLVTLPTAVHTGQKIDFVNEGNPIAALTFTPAPGVGTSYTNGQPLNQNQHVALEWNGTKWVPMVSVASRQVLDSLAGRNQIQNSLMRVNQRGTSSVTVSGNFVVDRWIHADAGNGSRTVSQVVLTDADRAAIGDENFTHAVRIQTTGSSGSGDYEALIHRIEGVRQSSGKACVLSFWAKAAVAGQPITAEGSQSFGSGGSPSTSVYSILQQKFSLTTAWTRYYLFGVMTSLSGKTLGTTPNTDFVELLFWTSAGSGNAARSASLGVQTSDIYVTGFQFESTDTPTPFERPEVTRELMACQRHFQSYAGTLISGYGTSGQYIYIDFPYEVPMRAVPTVNMSGNQSQSNASAPALNANFNNHIRVGATITATGSGFSIFDLALSADL